MTFPVVRSTAAARDDCPNGRTRTNPRPVAASNPLRGTFSFVKALPEGNSTNSAGAIPFFARKRSDKRTRSGATKALSLSCIFFKGPCSSTVVPLRRFHAAVRRFVTSRTKFPSGEKQIETRPGRPAGTVSMVLPTKLYRCTSKFLRSRNVFPDATSVIVRVPFLSTQTRTRPSGDSPALSHANNEILVNSTRDRSVTLQRST